MAVVQVHADRCDGKISKAQSGPEWQQKMTLMALI